MVLSVVLAVLAAASNATASVLQRKGARREEGSDEEGSGFSPKVILGLIRQPVWFCGVAAILTGFLLQAGALATGPIVLVQPILVVELPLTLLLASAVFRSRLHRREWFAVTGMSAGVALLLIGLSPSNGDAQHADSLKWVIGCAVSIGVVVLLACVGGRRRDQQRAAFLGVATGVAFGFTAALVAAMTSAFRTGGIVGVFTTWQTYAVLVIGPSGFFLLQAALRAGRLVASQPGMTLSNPLVAIGWGVAVFGERIQHGGWFAADVIGALVVIGATILLAGSPLLGGAEGGKEEDGQEEAAESREPEADRARGG